MAVQLTPEQAQAFVNLTELVRLWQKRFFQLKKQRGKEEDIKEALHNSLSYEKELDSFIVHIKNSDTLLFNYHPYININPIFLPR